MTGAKFKAELRHSAYAALLVAAMTIIMIFIVGNRGMTHGPMIFLIPVMIAATRWGVVPAVVAALTGMGASAFFLYRPIYSFIVREPQNIINLSLFILVAIVTSQLATRLKKQAEISRQREIDMRDLYAFSRRLAVAFDVAEIHAAIEDHLAAVTERRVVLFASAREATAGNGRRGGELVPDVVRCRVADIAADPRGPVANATLTTDKNEVWLVRAVSSKSPEFGIIAVNLGRAHANGIDDLRVRVETALADATATLDRLGVAHAINEARMRSQTEQLREALIGSVSHELRTPLASIMGAATVIGSAPALAGEDKLKALVTDVHDEAERLNNDIQNLLDASRISSNGIRPNLEWADPADIVNSALDRCQRRLACHPVSLAVPADLPMIHVDPVLIKQALVQVFDNAAKYSPAKSPINIRAAAEDGKLSLSVRDHGAGLTVSDKAIMWDRFVRGERHAATTGGSGLGLWIANAFVNANSGTLSAQSDGADQGTTIQIALPIREAAISNVDSEADE